MGVDQRGQQPQQRDQNASRGQQRLRIEKVGQQREKCEKEDHEGIAPGAQLQRFERQQNHHQRHASVAPEQGLVRERGGRQREQKQTQPPRPARQRLVAYRQHAAPHQHAGRDHAAPPGNVRHLHEHHPADDGKQEEGVAGVARQAVDARVPAFGGALPTSMRFVLERPSGEGWRLQWWGFDQHRAIASRQRLRWLAPWSGGITRPGKRSP